MELRVIKPSTITESMVTTNAVDDTGTYPVYSAVTAYTTGNKVSYGWKYWEALANSTGVTPGSDATKWQEVSASNKGAMFDSESQTRTTRDGSLTVTVTGPLATDGLAIIDIDGATDVQVTSVLSGDTLYDREISLWDYAATATLIDLYFTPPVFKKALALDDLPIAPSQVVTVTLTGAAGTDVEVGLLALGRVHEVGREFTGLTAKQIDYSTSSVDAQGTRTTVRRGVVDQFSTTAMLENNRLDAVRRLFKDIASLPVVVIGGAGRFESLLVWGLVSYSIDIAYYDRSHITVDVEGLL